MSTGNTLAISISWKTRRHLYKLIKETDKDRKLFFVYNDNNTREEIRSITEREENAIIVTFDTSAISIFVIYTILFLEPSKSRIRNLQSI